jgi:hypothetical protein
MVHQPALFGGIMLGVAAWLEVWAILFLAEGAWQLIVIPGLFFIAGLFLAGTLQESSQSAELAIGGICIAVAIGFVGWFWIIIDLMWGSLVSLGAGILILLGLVFIAGGTSKGY